MNDFLERCSDVELKKYLDALSDLDSFYGKIETDREMEFYGIAIGMSSGDIDKVLRFRKTGKYGNQKEHKKRIAFYPTVIDVVRIYDEIGEREIPTKVLVSADKVDSRPSSCVVMSSSADESVSPNYADMTIGQRLVERLKNSTHRKSGKTAETVPFVVAKPERMRVISSTFGDDVGNVVFNLLTDSRPNASIGKVGGTGGSTIITDNGIFIGFTRNEQSLTTAYFGSPTDLVNCVAKSNGVMPNSRYGSSHGTSSIPTELLIRCIENEVNGWVCLDNNDADDSGNSNCRRYIEVDD